MKKKRNYYKNIFLYYLMKNAFQTFICYLVTMILWDESLPLAITDKM
jgi:hypothetical protein